MNVLHRVDYGVIGFGMYRGKKWADLPKDYLEYIIKPECRISEDIKSLARKELAQRSFLDGQLELL